MPISRRPELALFLTILIWGLNFPIIKVPLEPMPPFVVNALRFAASAVVLGAMHARSSGDFWGPLRLYPGRIVLLGLLAYVGYQLCFILGVDRTMAGSAALIMASAPIWTALGARMMGLERLPWGAWLGLFVSFLGTIFVVLSGDGRIDLSADAFVGNLLLLLGAMVWAVYTVLSRPLMDKGVSATGLAFFGMMVSLPVLFGLGVWEWPQTDWESVTAVHWAALLFSGGLSTGAAYAWWNVAVRAIGPSQTAVWNNLVPVVALIAGVFILSEPIVAAQLGGGALILTGLYLMRRARLRELARAGA